MSKDSVSTQSHDCFGPEPAGVDTESDCDGSGGGGGGGGSGWNGEGPGAPVSSGCNASSFQNTTGTNDADSDGIKDGCEAEFTELLGPKMIYDVEEVDQGREPYWAVDMGFNSEMNSTVPRIGYLLSYYEDTGTSSHPGDSEFIIIDILVGSDSIYPGRITTSAHWNCTSLCDDRTTEHDAKDFQYSFSTDGGVHPFVYVSLGKHANYRTEEDCDIVAVDECSGQFDGGPVEMWGFYAPGNIGNAANKLNIDDDYPGNGCAYSRVNWVEHPSHECYFEDLNFAGWSGNRDGAAGPYKDVLQAWDLY